MYRSGLFWALAIFSAFSALLFEHFDLVLVQPAILDGSEHGVEYMASCIFRNILTQVGNLTYQTQFDHLTLLNVRPILSSWIR